MQAAQSAVLEWARGRLDFSSGCLVMGILNVTPDSFSDGGRFLACDRAVEHGLKMVAQGAAIIDIGGESTRPGSQPVPSAEQIQRVVPVIAALATKVNIPISIDTHDVEVARAAVNAGAAVLNDITALADERLAQFAAEQRIPVVLMHMQGTPATMQTEPHYEDVVAEVRDFLVARAERAGRSGIPRERLFIDPGIGFGKTLQHNLLLLKNLATFVGTGYRVLVGTSRKRFLGSLTGKEDSADRVFGTAATVALSVAAGASIVRVHDVDAAFDVARVTNAIHRVST